MYICGVKIYKKQDKIGTRCGLHILFRLYHYLSCQIYRDWQCNVLGFVLYLSYLWNCSIFSTTWFCFVEYSRYTLALCIANISTADVWCNTWQQETKYRPSRLKTNTQWKTDLRPLGVMQLISNHGAMVQLTSHTQCVCHHLSWCTTTLPVQHTYSHTEIMLWRLYTRITCLNTTITKRDKFETPVPKIKTESNSPKAVLLPYPPLRPEIHHNYTHKSSSYLPLHYKYQLMRAV